LKTSSPRSIAAEILRDVLQKNKSLNVIQHYKTKLPTSDHALIQELSFGVMRYYEQLSTILKQLMKKPLKAKDSDIKALLLIGIYQLIYSKMPAHAIVSSTVDATKNLKKPWAKGLVNGILRNFQRESSTILASTEHNLSATHHFPEWLLNKITQTWPDHWQQITDASAQRPPMTLRVNHKKTTTEAYQQNLTDINISTDINTIVPSALTLKIPTKVSALPNFFEGYSSVQDAGAQLAAKLLQIEPNQRILDACAAPGGKTGHIAEQESSTVCLALDSDLSRTERIDENLQRLEVTEQVHVIHADANQVDQWWDKQQFHRILLDAPCSATGVIRRHPDIKFLRQENDIAGLVQQQKSLLKNLWPLLKTNGILLYCTCSILTEENDQQITSFLAEHTDAIERPIEQSWGHKVSVGRQILPGENNMDGFYYAMLKKQP
jgi:16S rRNA (cytosine967-C5)-methyltransferase